MKNITMVLALTLLAAGLHAADVTAPAQGAAWCKNEAHAIVWNAGAFAGNKVKLILFDNDNRLEAIAAEAANSGSYSWTPRHELMEGRRYQVLVRTLDDTTRRFSGYFMLKNCGRVAQNDPTRLIEGPKYTQVTAPAVPRPVLPRIDRLDPASLKAVFAGTPYPVTVFGQGFGASQGKEPKWNILVAESGGNRIPLKIITWSDGMIRFQMSEYLEPGDWVLYVCSAYEDGCLATLTNRFSFHVAPEYYSYISGVMPQNLPNGQIPAGEASVALRITGLGFNTPNAGRGVRMRVNGTVRDMAVDSWSDTQILGRISTLQVQPGTKCRFFVYHVVNGAEYPSNDAVVFLN